MSKPVADYYPKFSISELKKLGYLRKKTSTRSGPIYCGTKHGYGETIGVELALNEPDDGDFVGSVTLSYTYTDYWTKERTNLNYPVWLKFTPCNYGGMRYWFECPYVINGRYCLRRVGTLYLFSKYFGCRECGNLAYTTQNKGDYYRSCPNADEIETYQRKIRRRFYNGKPTKKYQRLMRMEEKFNWSIWHLMKRLG